MRRDRERLADMVEAIERIEKYAAKGRAVFERDELVQVWVVHHIQVIGEAAAKVSSELQSRHPDVAWPQIVAMRNILVHEYFGIDVEEVWTTVEHDLPRLKQRLVAVLRELDPTA
ncbi:MAG: DUF86 domain-containing protein [bacterium]